MGILDRYVSPRKKKFKDKNNPIWNEYLHKDTGTKHYFVLMNPLGFKPEKPEIIERNYLKKTRENIFNWVTK